MSNPTISGASESLRRNLGGVRASMERIDGSLAAVGYLLRRLEAAIAAGDGHEVNRLVRELGREQDDATRSIITASERLGNAENSADIIELCELAGD